MTQVHFTRPAFTEQQRDNLATLAYVLATPERMQALAPGCGFAMSAFFCKDDDRLMVVEPSSITPGCGTSACAAGWGAIAGIDRRKGETWLEYCERAFGCGDPLGKVDLVFGFLFSAMWPNIPDQAAARIRIALAYGIPDYADMRNAMGVDWTYDTPMNAFATALLEGAVTPVYEEETA